MSPDFASGYFLGLLSGAGLSNAWHLYGKRIQNYLASLDSGRPLRLSKNVPSVFSSNASGLELPHILPMWGTYTRAFILHGERCTRPFLIADMKRYTGLSYLEIKVYLDILDAGGVIRVTPRAPTKFMMGYADRRKATLSLPYPHGIEPPRFTTRKL